jgi:hypothetical protein
MNMYTEICPGPILDLDVACEMETGSIGENNSSTGVQIRIIPHGLKSRICFKFI